MQGPRTTPPRRVHAAVGVAFSPIPQTQPNRQPNLDLAVRLGVHDRVDLSLRLRTLAVEFGPKIQLLRDALEISIAPAILIARETKISTWGESVTASDQVSVTAARLTAYVGTRANKTVAVWIAPTLDVGERIHPNPGSRELLLAPGALAGLVLRPWSVFGLQIEAGMLLPVAGASRAVSKLKNGREDAYRLQLGPGDFRLELNIAALFGSYDE